MTIENCRITKLGCTIATVSLFSSSMLQALEIEEVVVTAQKRAQSLQDVSTAVTALDSTTLSDGLINNVEGVQAIVPNVSAGNDFGIAKLFVRGIGLNSSFMGVDPGVAFHVDGAVISSSYAQLNSFFDLERIEVLRGPQGTLYGRNAVGGTFNLITRKPTDDLDGYAQITVAEYDQVLVEGAVGGRINDTTKGRIAFRSDTRDGYGKNTVSGNEIDDANKQSIRAHLLFDLNDDMDFLLTLDGAIENDTSLALKAVETANNIDPSLPPPTGATVAGAFADDIRDIASDIDSANDRKIWGINCSYTWKLNDAWTLQSISNYRNVDVFIRQDLDLSTVVSPEIQNNVIESKHFSEELQLHYNSEKLNGLIALFYFNESLYNRNNIGFESPQHGAGVTTTVLLTGDIDVESWALFANFTYDISESLSVKAGGRFTYETRKASNTFGLDFAFAGGPQFTVPFKDERSFNNFSPSLGLEWRPVSDILVYGTFSQGFKAGSIQGGQTSPILDPEELDNYEAGMKGSFLDNKLIVNISGFYYKYTDMQLDRTIPDGTGGFVPIFENAGEAEGHGAEVETTWLVTDNFKISGHFSYLNTEYGSTVTTNPLASDPVTTLALQDIGGNALRQSPESSWSIRGEYDFQLAKGATLIAGIEATYKDDQFFTEFNQPAVGQESYQLINANLKYTSPNEKYYANLWVKNLTDEEVYSGMFVISSGASNIIGGSLLPPRTIGLTLGYDF